MSGIFSMPVSLMPLTIPLVDLISPVPFVWENSISLSSSASSRPSSNLKRP